MAATRDSSSQEILEASVGHPGERFDAIVARINNEQLKAFADVESDFLALMWCLDRYRTAEVVPRGMGREKRPNGTAMAPEDQLDGVYRSKGNWFATILTEILGQLTTSRLASRSDVWGFSQPHQIDIAWPARDEKPLRDALICCETKLGGSPAYSKYGERGAFNDWSNRRKELKFQATDLKLDRQSLNTQIDNWDLWRQSAPPRVYSLWGARLAQRDTISKMIREAEILTATYSDGVGIYAFRINEEGTAYLPALESRGVSERVTSLDNVLGKIAAEIRRIMRDNDNAVPPPVTPPAHAASPDVS